MSTRDLPAISSEIPSRPRGQIEAIREAVQVLIGTRGDRLDRAITYRDLVLNADGSVTIGGGEAGGTGGGGTIVVNPPGAGEEPDLTPPPTPTGLAVTAGLTSIYVEWDVAVYLMGHGPGQTNVYGCIWPETDLTPPTFSEAVLVGVAPHALTSYAIETEPATRWCVWLKFQSADGVESATPAGGANGAQATTGEDPEKLLQILSHQITESHLFSTLGARIDLIDGPASSAGSVNARVQTVQTIATAAQATADGAVAANSATAALVTTVQSQVAGNVGMKTLRYWGFDSGTDGWGTASTATVTLTSGVLAWQPTASNPLISKTFVLAERFHGQRYTRVRARVRRIAGTGTWEGACFYATAGHGVSTSFTKTVPAPANLADWNVLEWDMAALDAGGSDWSSNEILGLRIDLVSNVGSTWEIDWIAVGEPSTDPLAASVQQEITTRADQTGYLGAQYSLRVDVGGKVGGFGISGSQASGAQPTIDFIVRADKFAIAPPAANGTLPDILPFVVQTTSQVVNGVTIPAGVYMDAAYIKNLSALTARLGNAWITSAMVGSLNAINLTAGNGTIGGNLRSSNYVAGSAGWIVQPNGFAEFSNVTIRGATYTGTIFAGAGTIGGCTITATDLRSTNFVTGAAGSGWRLTSTGGFEVTNGTFRGDITATSGTIGALDINSTDIRSTNFSVGVSGFRLRSNGDVEMNNLSARGNITANNLNAATGTFSGALTASAVDAVDTINLRGQSVTVTAASDAVSTDTLSGYQTLCLVTMATGGAPVIAIGLIRITFAPGTNSANVRILIDGSEERMLVMSSANGVQQDVTLIAYKSSTTASGSISVRLQASASNNVTRVETGTALVALCCKR